MTLIKQPEILSLVGNPIVFEIETTEAEYSGVPALLKICWQEGEVYSGVLSFYKVFPQPETLWLQLVLPTYIADIEAYAKACTARIKEEVNIYENYFVFYNFESGKHYTYILSRENDLFYSLNVEIIAGQGEIIKTIVYGGKKVVRCILI